MFLCTRCRGVNGHLPRLSGEPAGAHSRQKVHVGADASVLSELLAGALVLPEIQGSAATTYISKSLAFLLSLGPEGFFLGPLCHLPPRRGELALGWGGAGLRAADAQ